VPTIVSSPDAKKTLKPYISPLVKNDTHIKCQSICQDAGLGWRIFQTIAEIRFVKMWATIGTRRFPLMMALQAKTPRMNAAHIT
jgi:hypothetical protein